MVRKKKCDYHILIAQNFLSNISIDGSQNDAKMRIFPTKKMQKNLSQKKFSDCSGSVTLMVPNDSAVSLGTTTSLEKSTAHISTDAIEDGDHRVNFSLNLHKETPHKKSSFFRRIAKIMSSDDVIYSMNASSSRAPILEEGRHSREEFELVEHHLPESESHSSQFSFLKRLKSSITHADRWYVCSGTTGIPHAVFSYLPVGSDYVDPSVPFFGTTTGSRSKNKRSKSIFGSSDRMRHHTSIEELRPFVFRDPEDYVSLGQMRRKRNPSPFFTLFEKSRKDKKENCRNGEMIEDGFVEYMEVPQSVNREPSCERGNSLEERLEDSLDTENSEIYDPRVFDELALGKRTVIRLNCFIATTLHYSAPDRAKSMVNENFEEKFPNVNLTMSKLKSIKREMLQLAMQNAVDHHTLAISLVYFEKVVNKGLISKNNRKCVAGASLLIAMKMNDYSKVVVKSFIENAEDQLRESKSDILSYELPICSALKFKLAPPMEELEPHLDKLQFEMY